MQEMSFETAKLCVAATSDAQAPRAFSADVAGTAARTALSSIWTLGTPHHRPIAATLCFLVPDGAVQLAARRQKHSRLARPIADIVRYLEQLCLGMDAELLVDVGQMRLDRPLGKMELVADALPRQTFDEQHEHLALSRREAVLPGNPSTPLLRSIGTGTRSRFPTENQGCVAF